VSSFPPFILFSSLHNNSYFPIRRLLYCFFSSYVLSTGRVWGYIYAAEKNHFALTEDIESKGSDGVFLVHRKVKGDLEVIGVYNLGIKLFLSRPHFTREVTSAPHFKPHESIDASNHIWKIFRNGFRDPQPFFLSDGGGDLCVGRKEGTPPLSFRLIEVPVKEVMAEWAEDRGRWLRKQEKRDVKIREKAKGSDLKSSVEKKKLE
jgi:hypothetical protein